MELRQIERTDRGKNRLNAALRIYRETILPEAQNPERQILYWIDHSKDDLTDEFRCFALQRSNQVVGYLQYSYFREEHIFFFEYLCIQDPQRKGLLHSEALQSIEDFLAQNYDPDFTIIFEIAQKRGRGNQWEPDSRLLDYFKRLGFRKADFHYHYPILQSYDGEMSYPADLMVRLPRRRKNITQSEMRTMLRCIYFKHYLRWDRPFLEPEKFSERERLINELYSKEVEQIGDVDRFGTTGNDKRSGSERFINRQPKIAALVERIFGPKLLRVTAVLAILLVIQWALKSPWFFIPFVLTAAAVYCLAEDTQASRKLFVLLVSRLRSLPPQSS